MGSNDIVFLFQLLVNSKIISLDLPVKDVYKKIWCPEGEVCFLLTKCKLTAPHWHESPVGYVSEFCRVMRNLFRTAASNIVTSSGGDCYFVMREIRRFNCICIDVNQSTLF